MRIFLLFIVLLSCTIGYGQKTEDLLEELEKTIAQKDEYTKHRLQLIQDKTDELHFHHSVNNREEAYRTCLDLFYEYQSFVYDSALYYIERAKLEAIKLNNPVYIQHTKIKQGFVLLSSGLFKEAIDTLESVQASMLSDSLKGEYYSVFARAYFDLADYNRDPRFMKKHQVQGNLYLDTALTYIPANSNDYWSAESLRRMKMEDWKGAKHAFTYWMNNFDLPRHYYAIATSSLGYIYSVTGFRDKAIDYLIIAAIADIKTATKETVAFRNLANFLFQAGDKQRAYRYIILALEDATYYNARHRKIEIATILPIIEGERLAVVEGQKSVLIIFTVALTFLALMVLIFAGIIYSQLKKLKKVRGALQSTVNNLNNLNTNLIEANQIKEEYIGYFFNVNSEYIDKLDTFQKNVLRKIKSRQYDDLHTIITNSSLKKERQLLFLRFDEVFLKLFPNFITKFNSLFADADRMEPKKGELLNPEMRIFALTRLGINDSEKIARFLNLSVTTIYTYKTKVKSKSLFRDEFDEMIMSIKAF